jgi:hypothetical protein
MEEIPLTQGKVALVDDEDYAWLNQWKWYAKRCKNLFYATRTIHPKGGKHYNLLMHRVVLETPNGVDVDHVDHNGLNNQKFNLRHCTRAENSRNASKAKNRTSPFKGVYLGNGLIRASIRVDLKLINIGCFNTHEEAARAYDKKAIEYFGEFAQLNFPKEDYL